MGRIGTEKILNREVISYLVAGLATTAINYSVYLVCRSYFGVGSVVKNTLIAWIIAVLFAYAANRIWVFRSPNTGFAYVAREMSVFVASRLFSGFVDIALMKIFVDFVGVNDLIMKVLSNVVVMCMNYFLAKRIVFRKR